MHPFSVEFKLSDNVFLQVLAVLFALFIVITWFRNHQQVRVIIRVLVGILAGFTSYYLVIAFFAIIQSFYTTIKDNTDPNKQSATITAYKEYDSTNTTRESAKSSRTKTRRNIFYKPLLNYKDENGAIKEQYGDISFSEKNKEPIGTEVKIIIDNNQIRMLSPIKTFAFIFNILALTFLGIFYYLFYKLAKTGKFDGIENVLLPLFCFVIFPIAFSLITYFTLNIGYEYFILHKETVSKNVAIFCTGLGIFLLLCFYGFLKYFWEAYRKKQKKRKKKLAKGKSLTKMEK
ncbi:TMEM199/VMA12 family vacuolar ATPase assembly factor [Flavobacterium sp. CBA20B-1]|uniref:TMEM199/VMA12 family vacuolar ATPase assembly factor n=1 Tax=unclassified Flavobacterium TaxID=196869 RepID=UPI002224F8AF|nr:MULTISPECIES: TMEM199/VMA12 family vacuolar ATPase assembly factor [unclassified Flavobacterium]WCM42677.1 TMEM199/VMA12 family vacuolar ATPase assembly factor [Flavobacterium sp. CBA20B-1]